jgi:hypothetical protein
MSTVRSVPPMLIFATVAADQLWPSSVKSPEPPWIVQARRGSERSVRSSA